MVFKKTVSSHTDVVGEATEILQSVPVVVLLDDILYSSNVVDRWHGYCCFLTEKCDGLRDDLLWRFFSFSCTLFHFLPYF